MWVFLQKITNGTIAVVHTLREKRNATRLNKDSWINRDSFLPSVYIYIQHFHRETGHNNFSEIIQV